LKSKNTRIKLKTQLSSVRKEKEKLALRLSELETELKTIQKEKDTILPRLHNSEQSVKQNLLTMETQGREIKQLQIELITQQNLNQELENKVNQVEQLAEDFRTRLAEQNEQNEFTLTNRIKFEQQQQEINLLTNRLNEKDSELLNLEEKYKKQIKIKEQEMEKNIKLHFY